MIGSSSPHPLRPPAAAADGESAPAWAARPAATLILVAAIGLLAGKAAAQGSPQIEEVDLSEEETLAVEVRDPGIDPQELSRLVLEADQVFDSVDRPLSLTLYGHLADMLEAEAETAGLDDEERPLLVHALARRAELHLELGEKELAEEGLRR
ncbi:MAG: hypothetical protein MI919_25995, partial [Holophagales bacterium]|nr:hypothetical protein [Holophagales bacterium]